MPVKRFRVKLVNDQASSTADQQRTSEDNNQHAVSITALKPSSTMRSDLSATWQISVLA